MFIKLTRKSGLEIIVNSEQIRFIYNYEDGPDHVSVLVFDGYHEIYIKETVEQVMGLINDH